MESCAGRINKHLTNFSQFAGLFTKVIVPIVDTAVKMSTEEPVSAYGVFKAAKDLAAENKKSKKKQNGSANGKNKNKKKTFSNINVSKLKAPKSSGKKKSLTKKQKAQNTNKKNQQKEMAENKNTTQTEFNAVETLNLVDQFYTDDGKKLTKAEQKKKKDLEQYLVKHLEMDAAGVTVGTDSFDSDCSGDTFTDSDSYAGEYVINATGSFEDETKEDESSSTNEGDNQPAEDLAQAIISKANKKRKSHEADTSKTKSKSNAITEIKKSKKFESSRKSLPVVKTIEALAEHPDLRRTSIASVYDLKKKATSKSAPSKVSVTSKLKLETLLPPENVVKLNSIEEGKRAFKWLINPVSVDDFLAKYWEQKVLLVRRKQTNYFGHLISFQSIDQMLLKNHVEFTKNIDVTSYKNGVRETLNPEGRALPPVVWDHYGQGCSIRLLNPQTFLPGLYTLSATMQEYFHCLVGANAYLTPPNSQGFAPHYDDIEAFVLQIEGRKRWKLYKPRSTAETLPRYSSRNFTQEEIGEPILEEVLEPGDVLYFPRGVIHQASTEPGYHSLHITLSVYQKQSFADLFEKMLPIMMQKAIASNVDLRRGLPLHAWQHAGIVYSDDSTKERIDLTENVTKLMHKCIRDMPLHSIIDAAMDQLAKKFQHEALPPEILPAEKLRTIFGSRSRTNERGECICDYDIDERTNVRLLRANILRLVDEEDKIRIYYYVDNSKEYCEYEPNFIEIDAAEAASVEVLIKSYPQYVGVSQLPLTSDDQKINLVTALWERGLLMMEKPFR